MKYILKNLYIVQKTVPLHGSVGEIILENLITE